jgi:hypothetical protein
MVNGHEATFSTALCLILPQLLTHTRPQEGAFPRPRTLQAAERKLVLVQGPEDDR